MRDNKANQILQALLTHPTVREAAEVLSMSESTIYGYLRKSEFKAKYDSIRAEILQQSTAFLQVQVSEAAKTVREIMNDKKAPARTRLNASKIMLEYAVKFTEQVDILPRLEALEAAQAEEK